ncbi:MAG: ANTAR domain-containing protein [Nitriliruptoraceae bacterium]
MADVATIGLLQQREIHQAHTVQDQLQHALHSRISIEQARGILSEQAHLDLDDAFELLRSHARDNNLKLSTLAHHIVTGTVTATDLTPRT